MKKIGRFSTVILAVLLVSIFADHSEGKNDKVSSPLTGGKKWISEDKSFALTFPKSWVLKSLPFMIAVEPKSKTGVGARLEPAIQAKTDEEMLKELKNQAASNAPPTLESSKREYLQEWTGKIAGFPAAWSALAYTDRSMGKRVSMSFAIGSPKGTVIIQFMFVPQNQWTKLRPVLAAIAQSLEIL